MNETGQAGEHRADSRIRLGRHMPTGSKMIRAAEIAHQLGCETMQIFASNPTGWKPPATNPQADAAFAEAARALDLQPVVLHAPYLINLAAPDETNWQRSVALLTWTLQRAAHLGSRYVVVHTGSHRGSGVELGIARIAEGIMIVLQETPPAVQLLLENDVGAGYALGSDFEHLAAVLALLPAPLQERVAICLDTAHLWGAGHDLSTAESTQHVMQHFDETLGLSRLKVLHVNDTAVALGSHRDLHKRLGEGIIPREGLHTLLSDPRLTHAAALLETPIETMENDKEDWEADKRHFELFASIAHGDA
jgi:deoxyribonuclease-4